MTKGSINFIVLKAFSMPTKEGETLNFLLGKDEKGAKSWMIFSFCVNHIFTFLCSRAFVLNYVDLISVKHDPKFMKIIEHVGQSRSFIRELEPKRCNRLFMPICWIGIIN